MFQRALLLALVVSSTSLTGFAQDAQGARKPHSPTLIPQKSGTTQLLIAVSPVNAKVVWAAGAGGTYVVTTDGGTTWRSGVVPVAETCSFSTSRA